MQYEITRTTRETFYVSADNPVEALHGREKDWTPADDRTSVSTTVNCVGTGELVAYAEHPKFPDAKVEVTTENIKVIAKNGDTVFSARLVPETDFDVEG